MFFFIFILFVEMLKDESLGPSSFPQKKSQNSTTHIPQMLLRKPQDEENKNETSFRGMGKKQRPREALTKLFRGAFSSSDVAGGVEEL